MVASWACEVTEILTQRGTAVALHISVSVVCHLKKFLCVHIGRASLVFILRDVTRFTPLLARLVQ